MDKYIIGIDPGVTTGVAVLHLTDTSFELVETGQYGDPDNVWKLLHDLITNYKTRHSDVDVLCESFEARPDVFDADETPKYIISDIRRNIEPDQPVRYQTASQAKTGVPPSGRGQSDRLHAFGLYQRGARHTNDAIRHTVSYAIGRLRHKPLIVAGWGEPGK